MKVRFKQWDCEVVFHKYQNNKRLAIELIDFEDGDCIAMATTNIQNVELKPDEVLIKDYSENEGMLKSLVENEIVIPTDRYVDNGYVKIPICKVIKTNIYTVDITWKYTASKEFKTQRYFFLDVEEFNYWLKNQRDESLRKIIKMQTYAKGIIENDSKSSKDFK